MRKELYTPAALLAQSILESVKGHHGEFTPETVASAFLEAYEAIELAEDKHAKANPLEFD